MKIKTNIINIALKSNNNTLFTITCKSEGYISEDSIKDAVKKYYEQYHSNIKVELIRLIAHYTDIKVILDGEIRLLTWGFLQNVIL